MAAVSLPQTYKIAPSPSGGARAGATAGLQATAINPDARSPHGQQHESAREREAEAARQPDCDSVSRSPLMQALMHALQLQPDASGRVDAMLERALIEFARALNQAAADAEPGPQPTPERAHEAARCRASHEDELIEAFAGLQRASAGAPSRAQLRSQLNGLLREVARRLHMEDDRAGEATQPGALISVHA